MCARLQVVAWLRLQAPLDVPMDCEIHSLLAGWMERKWFTPIRCSAGMSALGPDEKVSDIQLLNEAPCMLFEWASCRGVAQRLWRPCRPPPSQRGAALLAHAAIALDAGTPLISVLAARGGDRLDVECSVEGGACSSFRARHTSTLLFLVLAALLPPCPGGGEGGGEGGDGSLQQGSSRCAVRSWPAALLSAPPEPGLLASAVQLQGCGASVRNVSCTARVADVRSVSCKAGW